MRLQPNTVDRYLFLTKVDLYLPNNGGDIFSARDGGIYGEGDAGQERCRQSGGDGGLKTEKSR